MKTIQTVKRVVSTSETFCNSTTAILLGKALTLRVIGEILNNSSPEVSTVAVNSFYT